MTPGVAVVGHVEWIEFARVERIPRQGEIVHVGEIWEEAAGGGAVAAVQLAKLAGRSTFFTALAQDERGRRSQTQLEEARVEVFAAPRPGTQRRAFIYLDDEGERTITTIGPRLVPHGAEPLPWYWLAGVDAIYFTGGDVEALRQARAARVLVATPRASQALVEGGVQLDALVRSGKDPGEQLDPTTLKPAPRYVISTLGERGGHWRSADGGAGTWAAAPLPGPAVDTYGAGDSFAAGLTFGLGAGLPLDGALELAARCGAAVMTGRGPYAGQLRLAAPQGTTAGG
jgi:ribokinase